MHSLHKPTAFVNTPNEYYRTRRHCQDNPQRALGNPKIVFLKKNNQVVDLTIYLKTFIFLLFLHEK